LFFDSGLDYSWEKETVVDEEQSVSWYKSFSSLSGDDLGTGTPEISPSSSFTAFDAIALGRKLRKSRNWCHNGSSDRSSVLHLTIRHIENGISSILKRTRSIRPTEGRVKQHSSTSDTSESIEMYNITVEQKNLSQEQVSADYVMETDSLRLPSTIYKQMKPRKSLSPELDY
jgi:hypothetical protein